MYPAPSAAQGLSPREGFRALLRAWVPGAPRSLQHSGALNPNKSTTRPLVARPRAFPLIPGGASASLTTPTVPWSRLGPMNTTKRMSRNTQLWLQCRPFLTMLIPLRLLPPSGAVIAELDRRASTTPTMISGTRSQMHLSLRSTNRKPATRDTMERLRCAPTGAAD